MTSIKSDLRKIKQEKKKSLYLQEISVVLQQLSQEEPSVAQVYVSRVDLSADTGICYVYFATFVDSDDKKSEIEMFNKALDVLKLYKPSIRKIFAQRLKARYVPDFVFLYDTKKDAVRRVEKLLARVQDERK